MLRKIFVVIALLCCVPAACRAEVTVQVSVSPQFGTLSDVFRLEVAIRGDVAGGLAEPVFEKSSQFRIEKGGTTTRHVVINTSINNEIVFKFNVYPDASLSAGTYQLPQGYLKIGGRDYLLKQQSIEIRASSAAARKSGDSHTGIDFAQLVDNTDPYVGQQILYRAELAATVDVADAVLDEPDFKGFWRESFGKLREISRQIAGSGATVHTVREALFPVQSGETIVPPRSLRVLLRVRSERKAPSGWDVFDNLWDDMANQNFETVQKRLIADPILLHVKALPPAPVPNLDYVPVGSVAMEASLDKTSVKEGESLSLVIKLRGDANLRPYDFKYETAAPAKDFKFYADKPNVETELNGDRVIMTKKFVYAIVPQHAGDLTLPAIKVVTFDPKSAQYKTLDYPATVIHVAADQSARQLVVTAPAALPGKTSASDERQDVVQITEDILPQHVAGDVFGSRPMVPRSTMLLVLFAAPLFALLVAAIVLRREKLMMNPELVLQRGAFRKASAALEQFGRAPEGQSIEALSLLLRVYLGERLRIRGESLTSQDAKSVLPGKLRNTEVVGQVADLLGEFERMTYGGTALSGSRTAELAERVKVILGLIDKGAK